MLRAEGLGLRRGGVRVLQGIDLRLLPGQVLGVLGPNGAGKSSLLGALCGELPADQGALWLDDRAMADWPALERARRVAVLPQLSSLSFNFRVEDVVAMGRLPHGTGRQCDQAMIAAAMAAADIDYLRGRNYLTLSGGERQRVHLARVLAQLWPGQAGQTLLLDEPTAMLDPLHQHLALQAVRALAEQGVAVLLVLHDLNLAARYCDRLLLLKQGQAQAIGARDEVLCSATLQAVFGLQVLVLRHPERGHPLVVAR